LYITKKGTSNMRITISAFLVLALMALPSRNMLSFVGPVADPGTGTTVVEHHSVSAMNTALLVATVGGTKMTWCAAMVGAAIGAVAFSGGLALGFAFVWAATCWSGG
jgi:hypothetical protein